MKSSMDELKEILEGMMADGAVEPELEGLLTDIARLRNASEQQAKKLEKSSSKIRYAELCGEVLAFQAAIELIRKRFPSEEDVAFRDAGENEIHLCPKCGGEMDLYVSIRIKTPGRFVHGITKDVIMREDVKLTAAFWDKGYLACNKCNYRDKDL